MTHNNISIATGKFYRIIFKLKNNFLSALSTAFVVLFLWGGGGVAMEYAKTEKWPITVTF